MFNVVKILFYIDLNKYWITVNRNTVKISDGETEWLKAAYNLRGVWVRLDLEHEVASR